MPNKNLVIVESATKAKTIGKYLGSGYEVKACLGHLRDLPKSTMSVDIENGFIPDYQPLKDKADMIEELKNAADKADCVYLATDPDREGEAISWHLKELLDLDDVKAKRVTFNEISKKVVTESLQHPREIDTDLVDAQQARRILDRIVGYQLSPLLWKKIRRGLSAGRVQSVATRLVVDREEEIRAFVPDEYWTLDVLLNLIGKEGQFTARFYGREKRMELKSQEEVQQVMDATKAQPFTIKNIKRGEKRRNPSPPFITSTLQQEASRKLNMIPKRTMAIAQQLYEGIDIEGRGMTGLITYMRTDSLRLSDEALAAAKDYITDRYGASFYNGTPRHFKSKSNAQDAHEAIRPTDVTIDPESAKASLTNDQYKLYKIIWSRFVASQMAPAVYDVVTIDTQSAGYVFRANHQALKFAGFTKVYEESSDDDKDEAKQAPLPKLDEGEQVAFGKFDSQQHFTQPPARYTEASLISAMEEKGFGRPSTYATTISTILDRDYVEKKDKHLYPTKLGEVVTGLMKDKFKDIIDVEFTAGMEQQLDKVEDGQVPWKQVLQEFYDGFHRDMLQAEEDLKDVRIKVPDEVTDEICELCGKNMVVKNGRFGKFLACPGFPECRNTKPIVEEMPGRCPNCGSRILKRKSKKGYAYYACEHLKDCGFMTWDVPTKDDCPVCGQTMFKKSGRGQRKPFCINEQCSNFTPEEKRGGYKKKVVAEESAENTEEAPKTEEVKEEPKTTKKTASKTKKTTEKKTSTKAASKKADAATEEPAAEKKTTRKRTTKKVTADE